MKCEWVGQGGGPGGRNWRWTCNGFTILHCGHPTANYPYYIEGHAGCYAKLAFAKEDAEKFMKKSTDKPKRARPAEDVMADIQLQLPDLAEHMYMDRDWIWYCGPSLQGEENKPKREALKAIGFRFCPGGHDMGDGETKGSWGHCCERPMGKRRRNNKPAADEEQEAVAAGPDWSALGL